MLDPGHGGKDPGAIGVSGTFEKHVSLAAALELKRQLEADGRYRVELTRARDVFIALEDRVERAQRKGAALFVSMHADALSDRAVRGASVYTLAQTASDAQSAALARKENSADRFLGRHGAATPRRMSRKYSPAWCGRKPGPDRHGSLAAWSATCIRICRCCKTLKGTPASWCLKAADIPSVLVEMGFMSNARDEAALRQAEHRRRVAQAMRRAIDGYFAGLTT